MARTETLTIPANSWLQLTNSDATTFSFQVKSGSIQLVATVGAVQPASFTQTVHYMQGQGELGLSVASLTPGTPGVNRVYGFANGTTAEIYVSHD